MTRVYLYPARRRFEIIAALFAGGYGLRVLDLLGRNNPLSWAKFSPDEAVMLAAVMITAAFAHAMGIWINGRWRWSPVLRFAAMVAHACVFLSLAYAGRYQTAAYVYAWGFALMAAGAYSAARDSLDAFRGVVYGPAAH
jgi:hypothetical protein